MTWIISLILIFWTWLRRALPRVRNRRVRLARPRLTGFVRLRSAVTVRSALTALLLAMLVSTVWTPARADTTEFSFTGSHALIYGFVDGPASVGGHNAYNFFGGNATVVGAFTGTQLEIYVYYVNSASDLEISIDGGAYSAPVLTPGAWGYQVVVTGLPDVLHTFSVRTPANQTPYLDADTSFRVAGAAPAMSAPVGYAAQLTLRDGAVSPYVRAEAGLANLHATNEDLLESDWPDANLIFKASCSTISLFGYCDGTQKITLGQDGVDIATVTTPATGKWQLFTISSGLAAGTEHTYTLTNNSPGWYVYSLMTLGGTGVNLTSAPPVRDLWGFYGDSVTRGTQGTSSTSSLSWAHRMGVLHGVATANRGIQATTVKNFGGSSGEVRTADITGLPLGLLTRIAIMYGTNDRGQVGGAETTAEFTASYTAMLNSIIAGTSGAVPNDCLSILPVYGITPNALAVWNACIPVAIAACSRPARCTYRDISTCILENNGPTAIYTDTGGDTSDGTHPTSQGYAKIAAAYNALLTPAAVGGKRSIQGASLVSPKIIAQINKAGKRSVRNRKVVRYATR